jgi:methyl-accepting chemotaxis protein
MTSLPSTGDVKAPPGSEPAASAAAVKLRTLCREYPHIDPDRAAQLENLASALSGGPGVERWAGVSLAESFLQDETVMVRKGWFRRVLDAAVQVLFLAPIIVTWFGLMQATQAYQRALRVRSLASESFLQGWQDGFGGQLSPWFDLSHLALYVIAVISVLIIAIVWRLTLAERDEKERDRTYRKLAWALTEADLELAPLRVTAPREAATELHKAATSLATTAAAVEKVGKVADRTQREAREGLTAVLDAAAKLTALSTAVKTAADDVADASKQLGERIGDASATTSAIAAAEVELVRQIGLASGKINSAVEGLGDRLRDAVAASHREMAEATDRSSTKIADALDGGAGQLRSALTTLTATGAAYTRQIETAAGVMGQVDSTVSSMPALLENLGGHIASLGDRVSDLKAGLATVDGTLPHADDTSSSLRESLRELQAAVYGLQTASRTLQEALAARSKRRFRRR